MSKKYITLEGLKTFFTKIKEYISKSSVASATKATNATKINNLELKRENGILKIGDVVIPQRKLLWEGSVELTAYSTSYKIGDITISDINIGSKIEICADNGETWRMGPITSRQENFFTRDVVVVSSGKTTGEISGVVWFSFFFSTVKLSVNAMQYGDFDIVDINGHSKVPKITRVYEIIE